ncbi:unnamed protein product, partial [Mesorhabditis spiculigera]
MLAVRDKRHRMNYFSPELINRTYIFYVNPYTKIAFQNATDVADTELIQSTGAIKFPVSLIFLIFQTVYLLAVRRRIGFGKEFSFMLLFWIGVVDLIQLICHTMSGIWMLALMHAEEWHYIFGAFHETCYLLTGYLTTALPIHRFILIVFHAQAQKILRPLYLKIIMLLYLIFGLSWLGYFLSGDMEIIFVPETIYWYWTYKTDNWDWVGIVFLVEKWSLMSPIIVGAVLYSGIILKFMTRANRSIASEIRLTVQVFTILAVDTLAYVIWYYFLLWADDSLLVNCLSDLVWVVYNGANSVIYFIFNPEVRNRMKDLLTCGAAGKPQGPLFTNSSSVTTSTLSKKSTSK